MNRQQIHVFGIVTRDFICLTIYVKTMLKQFHVQIHIRQILIGVLKIQTVN